MTWVQWEYGKIFPIHRKFSFFVFYIGFMTSEFSQVAFLNLAERFFLEAVPVGLFSVHNEANC